MSLLIAAAFLVAFSVTDASAQFDPANPGGVSITKNLGWVLNTGIGSFVETSSTTQLKNGGLHLVTVFWDLSGTPFQPAPGDGQAIFVVGTPFGPADMKVNPAGVAKLQLIINPNQPTP